MRFETVNAVAFGALRDETLELGPGLNVVYGPNEAGKSTWHAALYSSLCGIRRGRGERREDRDFVERHRPWSGEQWAVEAVVRLEDGRRIELKQDLEGRVDCSATDLDLGRDYTGEIVNDGSPDGSRWLGLERRSFLATACVRQGDLLSVTLQADLLKERLQRSVDTAGTDSTAAAAIERIEKFTAERVGSERSNSQKPLRIALEAVDEAQKQLDEAKATHASYVDLHYDLQRFEEMVEAAERRVKVYRSRKASDALEALQRRVDRARELLAKVPKQPDEIQTDTTLGDRLWTAREDMARASWRQTWVSAALAASVTATAALAVSTVLGVTVWYAFAAAAVLTVILLVANRVLSRSKKKAEDERFGVEDLIVAQAERISKFQADDEAWAELQRVLGGDTIEQLEAETAKAREHADELYKAADSAFSFTLTMGDDIEARLAEYEDELTKALQQRDETIGQLRERREWVKDISEAEENLAAADAELARIKGLADTLTFTREYLERAEDRVHRGLAPLLATSVARWLPEVTRGRYTRVRVDPSNMDVQVAGPGIPFQRASLLSHGTAEQVYLLLRVAMAEQLTKEGEVCPLILDEVTVHADSERKEAILTAIKALSTERQVILFTQEKSVLEWAAGNDDARDRLIRLDRQAASSR